MPWKAMNSKSSWCAPMPRWVRRFNAVATGASSGMKTWADELCSFITSFSIFRQARRRDRLPDPAGFFIRHVQRDPGREVGKLLLQNFPRPLKHDVAAPPGGDTAEDQRVIEIIKIRIVGDGVAEVAADRLVNFCRALVLPG